MSAELRGIILFMSCVKEINVNKQYGQLWLDFMSAILAFTVFIITYLPMNYLFPDTVINTESLSIFTLFLIGLYPVHKLIHYIPLMPVNKNIKKSLELRSKCVPMIQLKVNEPVPKLMYLSALIAPILCINGTLLLLMLSFQQYGAFFIILLSLHIGLSCRDLIYIKIVMNTPKFSYIEENEVGLNILIQIKETR